MCNLKEKEILFLELVLKLLCSSYLAINRDFHHLGFRYILLVLLSKSLPAWFSVGLGYRINFAIDDWGSLIDDDRDHLSLCLSAKKYTFFTFLVFTKTQFLGFLFYV